MIYREAVQSPYYRKTRRNAMTARTTFIPAYAFNDCVEYSAAVSGACPARFPGQ